MSTDQPPTNTGPGMIWIAIFFIGFMLTGFATTGPLGFIIIGIVGGVVFVTMKDG